jgi:hypothetical protein
MVRLVGVAAAATHLKGISLEISLANIVAHLPAYCGVNLHQLLA